MTRHLAVLLLCLAGTATSAHGRGVLAEAASPSRATTYQERGIVTYLQSHPEYGLFDSFLRAADASDFNRPAGEGPVGNTWLLVSNDTLRSELQQLAEKNGVPDSGTFADALSDLFAAQASEEGPSSKQVQAAVTIAQALRDAHVLSAAVDFYNNDTIGVAKYQTSVALPSYAEDRQYIVRAYASVAPHVPKQVLLLQPGGQLHTTAGDAMPIPPVYAKSTTHPNGDTAGSYDVTDYIYDFSGIFVGGQDVAQALTDLVLK